MQIFKGPCQAILDGSTLNKPILIGMNKASNERLESICKELGNDFD